ncbi:MAG: hypothetical protein JXA18_00625 [Chitinispirillaceae bacterium]|nr:hypothetical protein [Chitinispirillaceae bacterium]
MVFCVLYAQEIRATANIVSVELQKWASKRKVPLSKINYSIDTAFQRMYSQRTGDGPMESLPEEIRSRLKAESIDYCLLLYDFSDRAPGGSKKRMEVTITPGVPSPTGGVLVPGRFHVVEKLGAANKFNSIYCRLALFEVAENRPIVSDALWADKEECGDEVVQCLVNMIKKSFSEYDPKKRRKVPCWK